MFKSIEKKQGISRLEARMSSIQFLTGITADIATKY